MSTSENQVIPLAQSGRVEGGRLERAHCKDLPHNFCSSRTVLKALYGRKLHFNTDDLVNTPCHLGTKKSQQAGDWLQFILCTKTKSRHLHDPGLLPHCPTEQRKFLINCLSLTLISPGLGSQLRREQLPRGNSGVTTGWESSEKALHISSSPF